MYTGPSWGYFGQLFQASKAISKRRITNLICWRNLTFASSGFASPTPFPVSEPPDPGRLHRRATAAPHGRALLDAKRCESGCGERPHRRSHKRTLASHVLTCANHI